MCILSIGGNGGEENEAEFKKFPASCCDSMFARVAEAEIELHAIQKTNIL